jgi:hypothetical protein
LLLLLLLKLLLLLLALYRIIIQHKLTGGNNFMVEFYVSVSVHRNCILYKEPTRCNFGSIIF